MNSIALVKSTDVRNSLLAKIALANALIILGAKISVPFYPVPMSLQTLALAAIAVFAGRKVAVLSTAAYLFEGLIGFPVFVEPTTGPMMFVGPVGGYLFGFLVISYFASSQLIILKNIFWNKVFIQCMAFTAFFFVAISYLAYLIGLDSALKAGLYPFVIGEVCKIVLVASVYSWMQNRNA